LQRSDYSLNKALYENKSVLNNLYPLVKLGNEELFEVVAGGTSKSTESTFWDGDINWISLADLPQDDLITNIYDSKRKITEEGLLKSSARLLPINTVIVSTRATIGRIAINKIPLSTNQGFKNIIIKNHSKLNYKFLALMITELKEDMEKLATGTTFKEISKTNFLELEILLPSLNTQEQIINDIESMQRGISEKILQIETLKEGIASKVKSAWDSL